MQIHVNKNGQQYGPYSVEELRAYLSQGSLSVEDYAWYEGLSGWVQINQIQGILSVGNNPAQLDVGEGQQATAQQQQTATPAKTPVNEATNVQDGQSGGGVSASAAMERLRKLQKGGAKSASPRKSVGPLAARGAKGKSEKKKEEPEETVVVVAPAAWKKHLPLVGVIVVAVALIGGLVWWLIPEGKPPLPSEKVSSKDTKEMALKLRAAGFEFGTTTKSEINSIWIKPGTKISPDTLGLLGRLKNLQKLDLSDCNMDDMAVVKLGALIHLTHLDLSGNQNISDKSIVTLKKLVNLKRLGLDGTFITSRGNTDLQTTLENCDIVWKPIKIPPTDPKEGEKK